MTKKKVLVIGATGMIGGKIVNSFTKKKYQVRILTRDKKKALKKLGENLDVFEGDVLNPKSLIGLFNNIDGVYIHLNDFNEETQHQTIVEGTKNLIDLAKFHKTNRVILQTASIANLKNKSFSLCNALFESEGLFINSGLDYTILKPGYFLEALKFFLRGNQVSLIGEGVQMYNWVAGDEYADEVVNIIDGSSYYGKKLHVFGPEALNIQDALHKYCDVLKPNARFNKLTHDMMRSISRFSNNKEMSFIADYIKFMDTNSDSFDELSDEDEVLKLELNIDSWLEKQCVTS